jgi:hypothetical protein
MKRAPIIIFVILVIVIISAKADDPTGLNLPGIALDSIQICTASIIDMLFTGPQYDSAYEQGIAEAKREIAENNITLYTGGRFRINLDVETGLYYKWTSGSALSSAIVGRSDGHNTYIKEHIKKNGMPEYSLKPWIDLLMDPKNTYDSLTAIYLPCTLLPDGTGCMDDRGYDLWIGAKDYPFTLYSYDCIYVSRPPYDNIQYSMLSHHEDIIDSVHLVWGPENSNLVFLHIFKENKYPNNEFYYNTNHFKVFDLRAGNIIDLNNADIIIYTNDFNYEGE